MKKDRMYRCPIIFAKPIRLVFILMTKGSMQFIGRPGVGDRNVIFFPVNLIKGWMIILSAPFFKIKNIYLTIFI